jgi:hypothetical protein
MKNKILTYFSFIAVLTSILTILYSTIYLSSDLKFSSLIISIAASIFGALLAVFYKKLTTKKFKGKIYLSFAEQDRKTADFIREKLINKNFFLNIDGNNIPIGENIKSTIEKELNSASIFIVLISKNSNNSKWVNWEINSALNNKRKILPVLIEQDVTIPDALNDIKYADLTTDKDAALRDIIKALENNLKEEKPLDKIS